MYNLIVTGHKGAWDGNTYRLEATRFGEYTEGELAARYRAINDSATAELLSFPTLFAYEQGHNADARVGFLQEITLRSGQIRFAYHLLPDVPPIPVPKLLTLAWDLEINDWEMNRTHRAVKDVDLLTVLRRAGLISAEQFAHFPKQFVNARRRDGPRHMSVSPTVFSIPPFGPEPDVVSVMMSFDVAFHLVYVAIEGACADAGLRCFRADSIWDEATVIQDVFNLLVRSHVVIVDFSGKNSNVMYETGIAHTLGRDVIPVAQSLDDVPFDLRHHRVLKYLPNGEGLTAMRATLTERLRAVIRRTTASS